ncbi:MAG: tetratricopeptide repeat protein, partial [Phycisphaerales bacterium]|nr:tetratricopeptide repeat protein [Phycisphaerales bacterium]
HTRGDAALLDGRYADAVSHYEAYLERRPGRHGVLYDLGRAYEGMGETSAAREAFSVAYELDPDEPVYIEALARTMAANGEADSAFDMLERIALDTHRAEAYLRLGAFLRDEGLADEAVQAMTIAAHVQPSAEPYRALAEAYALYGSTTREIDALRHVLWFSPNDAVARSRVRALGYVPGPTFASPPVP